MLVSLLVLGSLMAVLPWAVLPEASGQGRLEAHVGSLPNSSSRNSSDLTELCFSLTSNLHNTPQRWPEAITILLLQLENDG